MTERKKPMVEVSAWNALCRDEHEQVKDVWDRMTEEERDGASLLLDDLASQLTAIMASNVIGIYGEGDEEAMARVRDRLVAWAAARGGA